MSTRTQGRSPNTGGGTVKLDELDTRLIPLLRANGRAGNRELGDRLGVSEGTVRARIRRLCETGVIQVTAITDYEAEGNEFFVVFYLQVEGRPVKEVARDVARQPAVIAVSIISGRYDILATLLTGDRPGLLKALTETLLAIPGIRSAESSVALEIILSRSDWMARR